MRTVAVAMMCKTPAPGRSKTRLCPPLSEQECSDLSACFIGDLSATIATLVDDGDVSGYAVYAPIGSEAALSRLLPAGFRLLPGEGGDFGRVLFESASRLLRAGHSGAILVNSDSPTLPRSILRAAVDATRAGCVVLSRAHDGGYTLIGLAEPHARLFEDIPWSTHRVHAVTLERARELGLSVASVPPWYDVDDPASLQMLEAELVRGVRPGFADPDVAGAPAPATRRLLERRGARLREQSSGPG